MRKSLVARLAHLFLAVMLLASLCSFIGIALISNSGLINEIKAGQTAIAVSMIELDQKTDFDLDNIIKIASNPLYNVGRVDDISSVYLTDQERVELETNYILYVKGKFFPIGRTYVLIDDQLIKIQNHPKNNAVGNAVQRIGITMVFMILLGTSFIITMGKRALKPIYLLNNATKELAKGNFEIQVENNMEGELGELTKNFNKMANELKSMEIFRRDFISNVSHEFKTPIAAIQGFAKLLQKSDLSDNDKKEYTEIIVQEADRMSKLSSNILKLSKLENQEIIPDQTEFSLDEQIRRVILILQSEWEEKNISFNVELDETLFYGNEELIQQVWLNLLDNAIKFTGKEGEISVKLYDTGSKIKVKIIDNGLGMTEEIQERIFEKFYQADKAHSSEGNGLGLPLVKRIVDLCGGYISVKSQPGVGSTFSVELPKHDSAI